MKISLCYLLLALIATGSAADCGPGGITCPSGACHYPSYIQGCFTYSSSIECLQCEYNYIKAGKICAYSPPIDTSDCCRSFVYPSGECSQCAPGLVLQDGTCKDIKIVGCLVKSKTATCLNCAINYALYGGRCFKKIQGCQSYDSIGKCSLCDQNYSSFQGFCIPNVIVDKGCHYPYTLEPDGKCSIFGCSVNFDFGCVQCLKGFRLLPDGSCKKGVIEGCDKYSPDGYCSACKFPLYHLHNGFCLSFGCVKLDYDGHCLECDRGSGFALSEDGHCRILNCLVSNEKECLVCDSGFVETFGGCQKQSPKKVCTICATGYYMGEDQKCHPKQPGCINYYKGRCQKCEDNLYVDEDGHCVPKEPGCIYDHGVCIDCVAPFKPTRDRRCVIEGCIDFSFNGCKACKSPYILTNQNVCSFPNCYEVVNGRCVKCLDGFAISQDGLCYKVDPFCKAYEFGGRCIECQRGYYLNKNGQCAEQKYGCNYIDGRCASCRAPFEYNPNNESCEIDGCTKYFLGGCSSCEAGYDLRYNTCKLPFCLISHKGHCRECDPNYIMKSDGTCVNKDEFCWKYDKNGYCIECAPKYFLSQKTNKCKPREPGCQYNENDRCYTCDKPFFFDGVRCEIYGCMKLSFEGCDQCFYPMEVAQNKLCSVVNCDRMQKDKCVACRPGYFIAKDGSCKGEDPKCAVYGPSRCQKCVKGYRLDNYGVCQYADEHCWDFSAQGHCTNCDRLYFLNQYNKCEIKDSNCLAYCGGRCVQCKDYYFNHRGLCYPNAKGCRLQKNIRNCTECESDYELISGICTPRITKLNWNSIDMDFWSGQSDEEVSKSKEVFSVGKTNKYNLDSAIQKGKGVIKYSSCKNGLKSFQVDDNSQVDGWVCSENPSGQFIGVEISTLQTFYAVDIKFVQGSQLRRFAVQFSENGYTFKKAGQFDVPSTCADGVVETFYFTPVEARFMRIVVIQGVPNIKFDFYYSNGEAKYPTDSSSTYIGDETESTILDNLSGELFNTRDGCVDKQMCWMGLQLCEAKPIYGFSLTPNNDSRGRINTVVIKYSRDGVNFGCYNECKQISLSNNGSYQLTPAVTGNKLRVYPVKWEGQPSYAVTFNY